jgi:neutral ceramidase
MKRRGVLLLCSLCSLQPLAGQPLQAGVASAEITPPAGFEMWGAAGRKGFAESTLDPLWARALVLRDGHSSFALVTLDLGRTFSRPQMDRVRAAVRQSVGIEHVVFAASHTHTGPNILDDAYLTDGRWEPEALRRVVATIEQASRQTAPARIGTGKGASYIGHNRQDGPAGPLGVNITGVRTAPQDPIVTVLRIDDARGQPLAILVHYAAHPVVLNHVTRYSADFPGAMSEFVRNEWGGKPLVFFLQGACGDINTHEVAVGARTWEARRTGIALGRVVAQVSRQIVTQPANGSLQIAEDEMTFPARWDLNQLRARGAFPTYYQWLATGRPLGYPPATLAAPVTTVLIDKSLAIVTMPGEPYVDLQIDLRERLPEVETMLLGYANGYLGYLPTLRAATRDGVFYGANAWPTIVAAGAPERMLDRGIIRVLEFLGKLKPEEETFREAR